MLLKAPRCALENVSTEKCCDLTRFFVVGLSLGSPVALRDGVFRFSAILIFLDWGVCWRLSAAEFGFLYFRVFAQPFGERIPETKASPSFYAVSFYFELNVHAARGAQRATTPVWGCRGRSTFPVCHCQFSAVHPIFVLKACYYAFGPRPSKFAGALLHNFFALLFFLLILFRRPDLPSESPFWITGLAQCGTPEAPWNPAKRLERCSFGSRSSLPTHRPSA